MILERGNMWDRFGNTDLFCITTNPIRRKDGGVVMGRGIALEAAKRFPRMPYDFGHALNFMDYADYTPDKMRYTGHIGRYDGQVVLYFMVKSHWREQARLDYIDASCKSLVQSLISRGIPSRYMDEIRVDMNFPGIGNGKLRREDVLPILEQLPDNIHVWEYEA